MPEHYKLAVRHQDGSAVVETFEGLDENFERVLKEYGLWGNLRALEDLYSQFGEHGIALVPFGDRAMVALALVKDPTEP